MVIRKAIVAAAGRGTRFLPQTKSMPKEMLPIVDRPTIQLVVEGLTAAGVDDITIVTDWRKRAIEDHFDRNAELEDWLRAAGKPKLAEKIEQTGQTANFSYVRQRGQPIGSARPIIDAAHLIGDQPFFFFFADDFFVGRTSAAQQLLAVFAQTKQPVVALHRVEPEVVKNYGVADIGQDLGDGLFRLKRIVGGATTKSPPSDLAVGSGYLLTPDIVPLAQQLQPDRTGEIGVPEAFNQLGQTRDIYGLVINGRYYDAGNPEAYWQTAIEMALSNRQYGARLRQFLADRLDK